MAGEDAQIRLGYDGRKVEAGFSALERRSKSSAREVERTFTSLGSRVGTKFGSVMQGVGQSIGSTLTGIALQAGKEFAKQATGTDLGGITEGLVSGVDVLDALLDRATKLGTSAESLQRLELFGKVNGRSPDEMADSMARLAKTMANVGDDEGAQRAVEALGIDIENFAKLEPDRQIVVMARAFQEAEKNGAGLAEIYDLLGKSGGNMLQILRQPVADLEALSAERIIPEEVVLRASQIADELTVAAEAKTKMAIQGRIEAQSSGEQLDKLKDEARERLKGQQAARDAAAKTLQDKIDAAPDKDAEKAAEEKRSRQERLTDLQSELAALNERARGHTKAAEAIEREAKIREESRRIAQETGIDEQQSRQIAQTKISLEEKAAKAGDGDGIRRRTRGYSRDQYLGNRFVDRRSFNEFFHPSAVEKRRLSPKSGGDQSFNEFFHPEATLNGRLRSGPLSAIPFNEFFPDPATGRRRGPAAVGDASGTVKMSEGASLLQINQLILQELQKLSQ